MGRNIASRSRREAIPALRVELLSSFKRTECIQQ